MPNELLDLNKGQLDAVIAGYEDRLFDQQCLTVHQGFWSGYYSGGGRKKPVKTILENIEKARHKKEEKQKGARVPDVDVEAFLEKERRFKERMGGDSSGHRNKEV